ncbi:hypothetical protein OOU_Y34scaffold01184g3 [Pyricularia oryzae Y34]|uniref:Uncharacterized protein n=1 Tax=Pyricularia oryzae (strain Y34) TaxID=1143189 RepID=A0AA97NLG8_PYRO3|nr:hypothetical protein OOU_Y34scaffold01184g3 [Pyricularia oryzae Y34]
MYSTEQEARCFLGKPDATDEQDDLKTPTTNADELGGIAAEFGSKIVPVKLLDQENILIGKIFGYPNKKAQAYYKLGTDFA